MISIIIKKINLKFIDVFKIFIIIVLSLLVSQFIISLQRVERDVNTLPISIIDNDNSSLSKKFLSTIKEKYNANIIYNESEGISKLASGKIDLFLIINKGYENQISTGEISNLFNVHAGYNPEYTKLILEVVSEEAIREWVAYKIETFNKDEKLEIIWEDLESNYDFIEIKEILMGKDLDLQLKDISDEGNRYEKLTYTVVGLISSLVLLLLLGEKVLREKLSGLLKRVLTFNLQSKKIYMLKIVIDVLLIFIITSVLYGLVLYINGVSFIQIVSLGITYLLYLVCSQIVIYLIIYKTKSLVIYNVAGILIITISFIICLWCQVI